MTLAVGSTKADWKTDQLLAQMAKDKESISAKNNNKRAANFTETDQQLTERIKRETAEYEAKRFRGYARYRNNVEEAIEEVKTAAQEALDEAESARLEAQEAIQEQQNTLDEINDKLDRIKRGREWKY